MPNLRFMFLGDLIGFPGRALIQKWVPQLKEKHNVDGVIVNGENSSNRGKGITPGNVKFLKECGVDVITSGNHIWFKKEIYPILNERNDIVRPANYPSSCPGKGYTFFEVQNYSVAIINLQGLIFMRDHIENPLKVVESILTFIKSKTNIIFIDFHAEATSEKQLLATFLDGQVSGVLGTHTHVQTADERILPGGTAFISDLGCCGALNSVIGDRFNIILSHFLTQMPAKFEVETTGPMAIHGVVVEVDSKTGVAVKIERIKVIDDEIQETLKAEKGSTRSP